MNKHNLMTKIASIATELDGLGLKKEASAMDVILIKLAQDYKCLECKKKFDEEPYKITEEGEAFCSYECREKDKEKKKKNKKNVK